jgi:hypothetical protein
MSFKREKTTPSRHMSYMSRSSSSSASVAAAAAAAAGVKVRVSGPPGLGFRVGELCSPAVLKMGVGGCKEA